MQWLIFLSVFHTYPREHTEWLLTSLAVLVTEETQGSLSHHCNLKQSSEGQQQVQSHNFKKKTLQQPCLPSPRWKQTLTPYLKPVFAESDNYENKISRSSWIGYRSQKLTMCNFLHMKRRKPPWKKGSLMCSKFMSKTHGDDHKKYTGAISVILDFFLDPRDSRHTFY